MNRCGVRRYRERDAEAVRGICRANSRSFADETAHILLALYCDYYIKYEPEHAFVLTDGDAVVGYICCAADFVRYDAIWRENFLAIAAESEDRVSAREAEAALMRKLYGRFPAHMHIDILDGYRRCGYGGKLVAALADELRGEGVSGIMLFTGTNNAAAQSFYLKHGFERIETVGGSVAFGLELGGDFD